MGLSEIYLIFSEIKLEKVKIEIKYNYFKRKLFQKKKKNICYMFYN